MGDPFVSGARSSGAPVRHSMGNRTGCHDRSAGILSPTEALKSGIQIERIITMKRCLIILLLSVAAFQLTAEEERQNYLVATYVDAETWLGSGGDAAPIVQVPEAVDDPAFLRTRELARFHHIRGFAARLTPSEAKALERSSFVRWVEPDPERSIRGTVPGELASSGPQQIPYGITMIRAADVWPVTRGGAVRVGVVDTGIDYNHPDLASLYRGGRNFVARNDDPADDHGHGTHVAGTIAALDNDFGVVGVAPDVELYALKVLGADGKGSSSGLIQAVEWAIENRLHVLNMSLGSPTSALLERDAFRKAEEAGIIVIAASGNDYSGLDKLDYPGSYPTVVAVGAVNASQTVASFSQRGSGLDFVAPGVGVHSTYFRRSYGITASDGKQMDARLMEYSPAGGISGELVDCGLGKPGGCGSDVTGKIALIQRGELTFAEKSSNAKAAGAKAVVIYNHHSDDAEEGGVVNGTLGAPGTWILTLGTSRSTGEHLLGLADRNVTIGETSSSTYGSLSGTSMATPHVAGAVALLRALVPHASKFEIIEALRVTAVDLGAPGFDTTYGHGRIDVYEAALHLSPHAFTQSGDPIGPLPRRRATGRR
jgi:serine protease